MKKRRQKPSNTESYTRDIMTISTGDKKDNTKNIAVAVKKVTITLALDEFVVSEIRKEAGKSQRSLKSRINEILEKYVKYYRMIELNGGVILPPPIHQFLINEVDEAKYAAELMRVATDIVPALITQRGIPLTLDNIIKFTFEELSVYGGAIRSVKRYIDERDGKTCLYFIHDYDLKWSRMLSAAFADHIESLLHYHTTIKVFSKGFEIKILEINHSATT